MAITMYMVLSRSQYHSFTQEGKEAPVERAKIVTVAMGVMVRDPA
jgi:hypothetical protein